MQIDISKLLKSPVGSYLEVKIDLNPVRLDQGVDIEKPIIGEALFTRLEGEILVDFRLATTLNFLCFRCTENFSKKMKINFSQVYIFTENKKANIIDQEQDFAVKNNGKLNPWPAIRQEILLDLPMKILCKKSCKGICPFCGQSLNDKKCKCNKNSKLKNNQIINKLINSKLKINNCK